MAFFLGRNFLIGDEVKDEGLSSGIPRYAECQTSQKLDEPLLMACNFFVSKKNAYPLNIHMSFCMVR